MSVHFDAIYGRGGEACGEERLALAVLEDGIRTLLKHAEARAGRGAVLRGEALAWLNAGERRDVFAYERICETLGIEPDRLRSRVLAAVDHGAAA